MISVTDPAGAARAQSTACPLRLSKRCEYGIKAAVRLARHRSHGYLQSREIASAEGLPAKFLESILLALRSASFLESKVGAGGGYKLAKDPRDIRVTELITALEPGDTGESAAPAINGISDLSRSDLADEPAEGQRALEQINRRLDESFHAAIGSLTLIELAQEAAAGQTA